MKKKMQFTNLTRFAVILLMAATIFTGGCSDKDNDQRTPFPAGTPVIAMTVTPGASIEMQFMSPTATKIWIETSSGVYVTDSLTANTWNITKPYTTSGSSIKIYGKITKLYCGRNGSKLIGLKASGNTGLTDLYCEENTLTSLDVTRLTYLNKLYCNNNRLTTLDLRYNTKLETLFWDHNRLSILDVSLNTKLEVLSISANQFSACALDVIYKSLPAVIGGHLWNFLNPGTETSRTSIAIAKGWVHFITAGNGTGCPPVE